ncbi:RagB/SusD family nutrient uptake outer membrane protein [Zhouia sp. PK063]|uniref:RagB/SusD family nutrient uptake outer membrane protein n=1 Tax=Zhouia sp. PK063 TaxID=3373602 RepID=UPI00378E135E
MKRNKRIWLHAMIWGMLFALGACQEQDDWLNAKRLSIDVTPVTLQDFQALLDNGSKLNMKFPAAGLLGTDNIILSEANFLSVSETEQNLYTFAKDIWIDGESDDWNDAYTIMEYANIVLEGLPGVAHTGNKEEWNNIKGQALFFRAFSLFSLSQLFCKPYISATAETDLGIPIRLSADVNKIYTRSTVAETYRQMLKDAEEAATLLAAIQVTNYRPNKAAALGLLAKIYLVMGAYDHAETYAKNALMLNSELMDFNDANLVDATKTYPFPSSGINNPEILFNASNNNYRALGAGLLKKEFIDSVLYASYDERDLRKKYFFKIANGNIVYNGSYSGSLPIFCGIATNELLLIQAECNARLGHLEDALSALNKLLINRYETGFFSAYTIADTNAVLPLILKERRKELPSTGNVRWEDIRRLHTDEEFRVTVRHDVNGRKYTLPPNDPKYALPIPTNELELSHLEQNIR